MPNRLVNPQINWVSFVDRAAVRDPQNKSEPRRFLLTKREGAEAPAHQTLPKGDTVADKSLRKMVREEIRKLSPLPTRDYGNASDRDEDKRFIGDGNLDEEDNLRTGLGSTKSTDRSPRNEESDAGLEGLTQKAEARLAKAESEIAELRKREEEALKKAEKAKELAKAEVERRETQEFVAKAEAEFGALPINAQEFGPVLKEAKEKLSKDSYGELTRVLAAADTIGRDSPLFKEMGRAGVPQKEGAASADLQKRAEELRKADSSLSEWDALQKAMLTDPDLQRAYQAQK